MSDNNLNVNDSRKLVVLAALAYAGRSMKRDDVTSILCSLGTPPDEVNEVFESLKEADVIRTDATPENFIHFGVNVNNVAATLIGAANPQERTPLNLFLTNLLQNRYASYGLPGSNDGGLRNTVFRNYVDALVVHVNNARSYQPQYLAQGYPQPQSGMFPQTWRQTARRFGHWNPNPGVAPAGQWQGEESPKGSQRESYAGEYKNMLTQESVLVEQRTVIKGVQLDADDARLLHFKLTAALAALDTAPWLEGQGLSVSIDFKGIPITLAEALEIVTVLS